MTYNLKQRRNSYRKFAQIWFIFGYFAESKQAQFTSGTALTGAAAGPTPHPSRLRQPSPSKRKEREMSHHKRLRRIGDGATTVAVSPETEEEDKRALLDILLAKEIPSLAPRLLSVPCDSAYLSTGPGIQHHRQGGGGRARDRRPAVARRIGILWSCSYYLRGR
jgi:hypothetical protein